MNYHEGRLMTLSNIHGLKKFATCTPFLRKLLQDTWHQKEEVNQESVLGSRTQGPTQEKDVYIQHDVEERS